MSSTSQNGAGRAELNAYGGFSSRLILANGRYAKLLPHERVMMRGHFAGARESLLLLPKKNIKTTSLAKVGLWWLMRGGAEADIPVVASSRDQATLLLDEAIGFVRRTPGLERHVVPKRGYRELRNVHGGRLRVLAADVDTADGITPWPVALVDELHRARSVELYTIILLALEARGAQMLAISTAGERESSPLGKMRAAAYRLPVQERDGAHRHCASADGSFVMDEWALDPGEDVHDMRVVKGCNPAPWHTLESLQRLHDSPAMTPWAWQRFTCGLWVSSHSWWLDPERWQEAQTDERLRDGDRIAIGFDGARTGDATALVACRLDDGLIEPLRVWEDPGDRKDWEVPSDEVDAALADAMERFRVVRGYFDPPLWQTELDRWSGEFGEEQVVRFHTRRTRMIDAVERFRTDIAAGRLQHTGDPTLTRHALNVQIREVRGGYWLAKPGDGPSDKIDAAVAAVLAYEARADALAAVRPKNRAVFVG